MICKLNRRLAIAAPCVLALLSACGDEGVEAPSPVSGGAPGFVQEGGSEANEEPQGLPAPVSVVVLPDQAEVRFYAHDDGSVSVIEEGEAWHRAVMGMDELSDGTALELFRAVAEPDQALPEALVLNHALMVEEGHIPRHQDLQTGWLRARLEDAVVPYSAACDDAIQDWVCDEGGTAYPDGPGCFSNAYGTLAWYDNDQPMRRYRTGFCSTGTVDARITGTYAGPNGCIVFRPLFIYRDGRYTNTHWRYWWSGPSGTTPRSYSNRVEHISGGSFAWGVKEREHTSSSCEI